MQTIQDISHGPAWTAWIVVVIFAVISAILLSGRGAWLIAGYNTASEEKKRRVDEKLLCRVMGTGMAINTVILLTMALMQAILPAYFAYIFAGAIVVIAIVMVILANTICIRK